MREPDIIMGPGDTSPNLQVLLYEPDGADGSQGPLMNLLNGDLTPHTVVMRYQKWDRSVAYVSRACIVKQTTLPSAPGAGDGVNQGLVEVDWLGTGGAVVPSGTDFRVRFLDTDNTGHQETFPTAPDDEEDDCQPQNDAGWLLMRVRRDFTTV